MAIFREPRESARPQVTVVDWDRTDERLNEARLPAPKTGVNARQAQQALAHLNFDREGAFNHPNSQLTSNCPR